MRCRFALVLILVLDVSCAHTSKPRPVAAPLDRVSHTIANWGAGLARDVNVVTGEDQVGQIALIYRLLVAVSPRAGAAVGLATLGIVANALTCAIPLLWYFSGLTCEEDPSVYLPAGRLGSALAATGMVGVTDNDYVAIPLEDLHSAAHRVTVARRRALRDAGATDCRAVAIEAIWHPTRLPQDACAIVGSDHDPTDRRTAEAFGLCGGNLLLWNLWADGMTVWFTRADCRGTPAAFAISSRDAPGHDLVLLAVVGPQAMDLLTRLTVSDMDRNAASTRGGHRVSGSPRP